MPFRWIWAFLVWIVMLLVRIIVGLFGPPAERVMDGVRGVKGTTEGGVGKFLDFWARLWRSGSSGERLREERIGVLGVPVLAGTTLAIVWYGIPIARVLNIGRAWFIVLGFGVWIISLLIWRTLCRIDRTGKFARAVQGVHRSTGLRRLDQVCLLVSLTAMPWLTFKEQIQLLPLTVAAIVAFVCLLAVPYQQRSDRSVQVPRFPIVDDEGMEEAADGEFVDRHFEWQLTAYGTIRRHAVDIRLSLARAALARTMNAGSADLGRLVEWALYETPEIDALARRIHDVCFAEGYSILATVTSFAAACQSIRYVTDIESKGQDEYWRYPVETLADQVGDCEDFAILLCALLRRAGFRSLLVVMPGHAAAAVEAPADVEGSYFEHNGVRYYFCETTAEGWSVGELPPDLRAGPFTVLEVPAWGVVPA